MASNSDGSGSNGTLPRNFTRDYDTLKQQYDKTTNELSTSRRRCDHALNDLDYYREQHRAAMNQLEVSSQDSASLRTKYTDLCNEKLRLDQENQRLRKEMGEVHRQQKDALLSGDNGNADSLYISHSQALSKLEVAKDENNRIAKQCELMGQERNLAQREIASLKQQVLKLYKAHQTVQQQYEEAEKQIVAIKIKANKDIKRLQDDRNATAAEYTLVMSERDQVHKEMEKLSEDLSQALKKSKMLDADNQELVGDKQAIGYQLESLRREIASALYERDKALKECADLREKFGELGAASEDNRRREQARSRHLDSLGGPCENTGRKDNLQSDVRSIGQRQRLDNLDQANQELESLRKSLDKAQTELREAVEEAEVSKGRRDWAFSERDKIVQERESIRTLCDNMRKERDRAVSELAESLRESDAVKKQRNELLKEASSLKEMLEAHIVDRDDAHFSHLDGGDTVEVELTCDGPAELGLELAGGRDDPHFPGDGAVYVAAVSQGSIADGKLRVNDRISKVNDVDCSAVSRRMVMEAIRSSLPVARIAVSRRRRKGAPNGGPPGSVTKWVHTVRLVPGCHGLTLNKGVYVSRISDGSLAAKDKSLSVGDRILRINDKSIEDIEGIHEAMRILNDDSADVITVTALKISHPECPNVFTPVRRHKRENRSSQTDEHDYLGLQQEKNNSGAWLKEKIDLMRGRRHAKDSDKKKYRNSSPIQLDLAPEQGPEQAIAELDLVLDSYRGNANIGTVKRAKRAGTKEQEKNGGTWPKARAAALLQPVVSTVVARKKERPALSLLKEGGTDYYRNSTPVPLSLAPPPTNRHSVYKSVDGGGAHFSTVGDSFEKLRSPPSNRLSANMNSDNSLDYPVHRYVDKDVVTYYKKYKTNVGKYFFDCDRESIEPPHGVPAPIPSHSRIHSQLWAVPRLHYPIHPHPHVDHSRESFSFEPPPFHHTHSPSDGAIRKVGIPQVPQYRDSDVLEVGTFPRKRENQRFRVPSNPSVTSKVSTGSIERSSERGSPMPIFHVEVLSPGEPGKECPWVGGQHKPLPGELRRVHIDKSNEPLGIQINCPDTGGIFVSTVNDNSLASRVGLQIGDQLLEVCGINMRNATYNLAANVLRQCGNSITMLVQYSPDKFNELEGSGSCTGSSSNDEEGDGEATPCNSPKEVRKTHPAGMGTLPSPNTLIRSGQPPPSIQHQNTNSRDDDEPRYLYIETLKTSNLGISLVGGNAAGIFIHSVQPDSLAYHAGLRTGDQILEYNGSDLRSATAEEAAYELAKPADKVTVLAHYRIDRYNEIKDKPGDSLYVRCGFDRSGNDLTEPPQLAFSKDDVLYVDNTMFNGVPGQWRAWRLDGEGRRQQCGVIPSKYKVEEELLLRRGADPDQNGRSATSAVSTTARRSFFRRKKHQRHSKELASFCSLAGSGWYSDGGSLHEEPAPPPAYQRVERLAFPEFRPVLVLGPLAECVVDKLVSDFPDEFGRAPAETRRCSQAQLDRELADGHLVEYRRRGSCWECVTVAAVRQVSRAHLHCMLDVAASSVERLHRHAILPIVLLVKFKSTKQIREVKDAVRFSLDKLSGKAAKEMFEHGHKLEAEYRHLVTAVVAAGANVAHVCAQVKAAVDAEHRKSQWVSLG